MRHLALLAGAVVLSSCARTAVTVVTVQNAQERPAPDVPAKWRRQIRKGHEDIVKAVLAGLDDPTAVTRFEGHRDNMTGDIWFYHIWLRPFAETPELRMCNKIMLWVREERGQHKVVRHDLLLYDVKEGNANLPPGAEWILVRPSLDMRHELIISLARFARSNPELPGQLMKKYPHVDLPTHARFTAISAIERVRGDTYTVGYSGISMTVRRRGKSWEIVDFAVSNVD
jgi:hypothetical protein